MVEVLNGPGMAKLASLTLSGNTMPFAAANNKDGLIPTLFTAPHAKLPQLTYVRAYVDSNDHWSSKRCLLIVIVACTRTTHRTHIHQVALHPRDRHQRQHVEAGDGAHPQDADAGAQGTSCQFGGIIVCVYHL